eukprot:COSAG01_NODE_2828_length_7002_cov_4.300014_2_plen_51_part_00
MSQNTLCPNNETLYPVVSFLLSDKDWDDVKFFGNATLVPNDDWVLWRRKS